MTEMDRKRILVIPDVHGRDFWKRAVEDTSCERIVFLGDYVDPYKREGIDGGMALGVFFDVLELKKRCPDRVVLLLGNHDLHYLSAHFRALACGTRYDEDLADILSNLMNVHRDDFCLAHEETVNGKRFLFTHAGVTSSWYQRHYMAIRALNAEHLNGLLLTAEGVAALAEVGRFRGGAAPSGSMVWADSDEMRSSRPFPDVYQIFGHSQQKDGPIITDHYACLDCRQPFVLDEQGGIQTFPSSALPIQRMV